MHPIRYMIAENNIRQLRFLLKLKKKMDIVDLLEVSEWYSNDFLKPVLGESCKNK